MKNCIRFCNSLWLAGVCASLVAPLGAVGATVGVNIMNFSFQPSSINVNVGDTVTWTQKDTTQHTSTSSAGLWNSPLLSVNQTFSRTFDAAGSFPYHCTPHPFMTASVTVQGTATNQPPTVSITSPANGATLTDTNVTIQATASDPDGTIAQVQFFEGQTSLGTATSAPYQVTVPLGSGTHTLTAQATDNLGASTVSNPIHITVNAATVAAPTLSGMTKTPDNKFQFTVQGTAGRTYLVQASSDLQTWSMIQTIPAPTDTFTVTNAPPADATLRFYRLQLQQ